MPPTPQDGAEGDQLSYMDGDRIVISGMSGLYPESKNIKELSQILYNKMNPVTASTSRWRMVHHEVPQFSGKVPEVELFDANFFKIHQRLGEYMDFTARKLLEHSFQAIYDAGVSPGELSGKKVAVFVGISYSETEKAAIYGGKSKHGLGLAGCSRTMFANRISYWLNVKGPSLAVDAACCSGTAALEQGCQAIARGECEAAIVGATQSSLHPQTMVQYNRIIKMCFDGKTRCFDEHADGCARSEAVSVMFLQKAKHARRIYADVVHVKTKFIPLEERNDGPNFGFYRQPEITAEFLRSFYKETQITPKQVEYIEAFGSADAEADKSELEALDLVFGQARETPVLVGSLTSNIGYTEAVTGLSGLTKVLIGYQNRELACNLHCENPRQDVVAVREGRMKILTEHEPFTGTYAAVNGLSFTGIHSHTLLRGHLKPKNLNRYKAAIPRLISVSGRHKDAVNYILDDLQSRPVDPEELALLHSIHKISIPGHLCRGVMILETKSDLKTESLTRKVDYFDDAKRPLWFVYSGMGSQWSGMGKQLLRIPIFAAAIEKCHRVLKPKGLDIRHIITWPDKSLFDNILYSFVGIAAIQIGLTDILRALGITPDSIIGHSVGELGCAYADGCFTAEEMILAAYYRGLVSIDNPLIRGSMAAVGRGNQQIASICPPEIDVACHNGPDSCTLSGPSDSMKKFVDHLTSLGIFTKQVASSGIAYHSRYIASAGPALRKYLSELIKRPKPRSSKWISTSVPQEKWNEPLAQMSSADYYTNNLLSPVLFEEGLRLVPPNAVLVEVAPHGLLQAILSRSLPPGCTSIPLTKRGATDNVVTLLDGIGRLFMDGFNPLVEALYPKVDFPVAAGTPYLSHLLQWAHQEPWPVPLYVSALTKSAAVRNILYTVFDDENTYLQGHVIRGKRLLPFSAALVAVWDTLAMSVGAEKKQLSVQFRNVLLYSQPELHDHQPVRLRVSLFRGTGLFEVMNENSKVATGTIIPGHIEVTKAFSRTCDGNDVMDLSSDDVYRMLNLKDYNYTDQFQSIQDIDVTLTEAQVTWDHNWVTFLDSLIQLNILNHPYYGTSQLHSLRKLCIDVKRHSRNPTIRIGDKLVMNARVFKTYDCISCGGVLLENLKFNDLPNTNQTKIAALRFIPRFGNQSITIDAILQVYLQIIAENLNKKSLNVVVLEDKENVYEAVKNISKNITGLQVKFNHMSNNNIIDEKLHDSDTVLLKKIEQKRCPKIFESLKSDAFLISFVEKNIYDKEEYNTYYHVLSSHDTDEGCLKLLKWRPRKPLETSIVTIRYEDEIAQLAGKRENLKSNQKLVILTTYQYFSRIQELVRKWKNDTDRNDVNLLMVDFTEYINLDKLPNLDLVFSIFRYGTWGGEYFLPLIQAGPVKSRGVLDIGTVGNLETLQWAEIPFLKERGVPIIVHYAGLNYRDMKRATGSVPFDPDHKYFGMDYSGVTCRGDRVMGIVSTGAIGSHIISEPELMWPIPNHWTMEDAATVPQPYAHAFYILGIKSKLTSGMRVLIHGGAGALGQAAIAICLAHRCEVFTSVSDVRKKRFLLKLCPELKEDHIGNSRDSSFGDMVMSLTEGYGCDIIIGCQRGDLKNVSLRCSAAYGVTFDTVQLPTQENYKFGLSNLTRSRNYIPIDFSSIFTNNMIEDLKLLKVMISEGIARGYVRPISRVLYDPHEVSRAFHLIAKSQHRGRAILRMTDAALPIVPRFTCSSSKSQIIICNESDIGVLLAEKLINNGARKLTLHINKPPGFIENKIESWRKTGLNVKIKSKDLRSSAHVYDLLTDPISRAVVEGIFVILKGDKYEEHLGILKNIDTVSRELCPSIRNFIVISFGGKVGQEICMSRLKANLPAKIIQVHDRTVNYSSTLDLMESITYAMTSKDPVLCTYSNPECDLQQISAIAGIDISQTTDNRSLAEMGWDTSKSEAMLCYLHDNHNVTFTEDIIPTLTTGRLMNLVSCTKDKEFHEEQGLGKYLSYVDPDELQATTNLVFLPTLSRNSVEISDNFDISQTSLFIIPGLEGHCARFRTLCERLKLPAAVLQGVDNKQSIEETADSYAKFLLNKIKLADHFYLLGYEYGVFIALEVAAILERHGLIGTVFCIGSAPEDFSSVIQRELAKYESQDALQTAVLEQIVSVIASTRYTLDDSVRGLPWNEKYEACLKTVGKIPHSGLYIRSLVETFCARVMQAKEYKCNPKKLQSLLVFLRAKSADSDLQKYAQRPVTTHDLNARLSKATEDLLCTAIINRYLSSNILEAVDKMNTCETYSFESDIFSTAI